MRRSTALQAAGFVFVLTWLIYAPLGQLVLTTWQITGDEPHYLLAAHSLVYDHDLDLANNYAQHDYAAFYPSGALDPHVKVQPDGRQYLSHDIGLPVLLALPYALGGRAAVMQWLAFLGALLAAQMTLLGAEASGRWWAGLLSGLALALTAPLGLYVFQIYPELTGGLLLTWALRQVLATSRWGSPVSAPPTLSWPRAGLITLASAALPWLSGRYAPLALGLAALALARTDSRRGPRLAIVLGTLASLMFYLAVNYTLYGGPTPSATPAGNAVVSGFRDIGAQQIGRGLIGWWLDQHRGLLIFGPQLALAFIGLPHLWRRRGWAGLAFLAPILVMWGLASAWGGFYSGWEVSAKFLMVGVPPLAASVAAGLAGVTGRLRRGLFWPLAAGLITVGVCNGALMLLDPFTMLHLSPVAFWELAAQHQLRDYFPAAGTRYIEYPPAGASEWRAAAGQPAYLDQSPPIAELSIGWYVLTAQAQVIQASAPNATVLTVDGYSSEAGEPLFHVDVRAREADPATGLVTVRAPFFNPYVDRWDFPFYMDVRATGAAALRLTPILIEPDPGPTYLRAGLWGGGLLALVIFFAGRVKQNAGEPG